MEADAAVHHLGLCAQPDAQLVVGVVVAHAEGGAALLQHAVEEGVEHELGILLVVAHLSAEREVLPALGDAEVDGVQPHVVDGQRVYVSAAVESRLGRRRQVKQQVLEVDVLSGLQQGGYGVVALALDVQLHVGQQSAQGGLVYHAVLHLCDGGVGQHGQPPEQPLVVAAGIQLDDEVAALCTDVGGVGTGLQQQPDVAGPVDLGRVAQRQVVQQSADAVGQPQVGVQVDVSAQPYLQGLGEQSEAVEVYLVDVGGHGALQVVAVHQGVHADNAAEQRVAAVDGGVGPAVPYLGLQAHVVQVPASVAQLADVSVGIERGAGRQEVGALAAGLDVGGDGIDGVAGHEVVQVQPVDADGGVVAHQVGIELSVHADGALPLAGGDVSGILCAVGPDAALGGHGGDAVVALHVARQGGHEEVHVLGLGAERHVGTQPAEVVEVGHEAVGTRTDGGRQRQVEAREVHRPQVAPHPSPDGQRIVRPALLHIARQGGHEGQQVLAAQRCVEGQLQAAGADGVGERQGEVEAQRHLAVGGPQVQRRHVDAVALHGQRTGVQPQPGHVYIVVGQPPVVPVQTAHRVGGGSEVGHHLTGHEPPHADADVNRVGGYVDGDVGAHDGQAVGRYLPQRLALGGVLGHRVAHQHVQPGVLQPGAADVDGLAPQVDAAALQCQPPEVALHADGIDIAVGIEPGVPDVQLVDHHLAVQQRPQLHVGNQMADVGNGVAAVYRPESVDAEVQGERQLHVADADLHAQVLRGDSGHHVDGPVLDDRHVEQAHHQQEQQHGAQHNA